MRAITRNLAETLEALYESEINVTITTGVGLPLCGVKPERKVSIPWGNLSGRYITDNATEDPFAGTGSTSQAAIMAGRNSIANEIESAYVEIARRRIMKAAREYRAVGATEAEVIVDGDAATTRIPAPHGVPVLI